MAMIRCPECGKGIPEDTVFCPHCGYMMTQEERENAKPYVESKTPVTSTTQTSYSSSSQTSRPVSTTRPTAVPDGSLALGLILGLTLGILGIVIAALSKGQKTIKGAGVGFGLMLGLAIIAGILFGTGVIKI